MVLLRVDFRLVDEKRALGNISCAFDAVGVIGGQDRLHGHFIFG